MISIDERTHMRACRFEFKEKEKACESARQLHSLTINLKFRNQPQLIRHRHNLVTVWEGVGITVTASCLQDESNNGQWLGRRQDDEGGREHKKICAVPFFKLLEAAQGPRELSPSWPATLWVYGTTALWPQPAPKTRKDARAGVRHRGRQEAPRQRDDDG